MSRTQRSRLARRHAAQRVWIETCEASGRSYTSQAPSGVPGLAHLTRGEAIRLADEGELARLLALLVGGGQ